LGILHRTTTRGSEKISTGNLVDISFIDVVVMMILVRYGVRAVTVVKALERLIGTPEPDHPLRAELAEEYCKNRSSFMSKAERHTRDHAESRP